MKFMTIKVGKVELRDGGCGSQILFRWNGDLEWQESLFDDIELAKKYFANRKDNKVSL